MQTIRPKELSGATTKVKTACGNLYFTLNFNNNSPQECFITLGKAGGCSFALMQAVSGLITVALQYKAPMSEVLDKLDGIKCHRSREGLPSCVDGIALCMKDENIGSR